MRLSSIALATALVSLAPSFAHADPRSIETVNVNKPVSATNFQTIQAAIDAVPAGGSTFTIHVAPGKYLGHVDIPQGKKIILEGMGKKRSDVLISNGLASRAELATIKADADDLHVTNLTVENTAGPTAGPQMALYTGGRRQVYENVEIKGWQDTLGIWNSSQTYFHDCSISGSVDFIYSGGTGVFEHCDIVEIRDNGGDLTAPSIPEDQQYGFVFLNCHCISGAGVRAGSTGLMRPWRPAGASAFINCMLDSCISSAGWDKWDGREATCRAIEFGSKTPDGKLINLSERAPWAHKLTAAEADEYAPIKIFKGWDPTKTEVASK